MRRRLPPPAESPPVPVTFGSVDRTTHVGGFRLTETTHAAGMRLPRHRHDDPAITFVLRGGFREVYRSADVACVAGGLLFKAPGEPHANVYGPAGARSLLIDASAVDEERRRLIAPLYDGVHYAAGGAPNRLAAGIARELRAGDDAARLAVEGLLLEMLAAAARARAARGDRADARGPEPAWLRRAVELLHAHRSDAVTLDALAAAVGVHPARLARAFRRRLGETPGAYQRRLRVEWARDALRRTDAPIAEIAVRAGFADQSHLTRVFRAVEGTTPAAFRGRGA